MWFNNYAQRGDLFDGFTFGSCNDIYNPWSITSNWESDFGRYDVMLEPPNEKDNT